MEQFAKELVKLRGENSKTFRSGNRVNTSFSGEVIHYKDDYESDEEWKDIDLRWDGRRLDKAPYILEVRDGTVVFTCKKTGDFVTFTTGKVGDTSIAPSNFTIDPFATGFHLQRAIVRKEDAEGERTSEFGITLKGKSLTIRSKAWDADGRVVPITQEIRGGKLIETIESFTYEDRDENDEVVQREYAFPIVVDPEVETWTSGTDDWAIPDGVEEIEVLVVAGGGGGGQALDPPLGDPLYEAGGGGAGGLIHITAYDISGKSSPISVTVGSGGAGSTGGTSKGVSGGSSIFGDLTAVGGGGGGSAGSRDGADGGSGGGASATRQHLDWNYGTGGSSTQTTTNDGYAASGFGNAGGTSSASSQQGQRGGGATSAGSGRTGGGAGKTVNSVTYSAGGYGGQASPSAGGANTGNGGGGGQDSSGAAGGSGIVKIWYELVTDNHKRSAFFPFM